jgi:alkylation response protein AidB-like acyl-CoA dehydrogenase
MQFGLNESQEFLRNSARKFFSGECAITDVRRLMATDTAFDANLWAKLAEQGYTGIIFPEEFGGVGLGIVELILLMEEAGRALLPGPFFSTVVMAGSLLESTAKKEQKRKYLEPICRGEARATVAFFEAEGSWDLADVHLTEVNGRLRGEKLFVPDAAVADWILVAARNGVFLVDAKAPGTRVEPMHGMDLTRKLYSVQFDNTPGEKIGETNGLTRPGAIATAALAAEMVGGMQRTLDLTVEYAKTRKQFGKPIGIFQAVQHQCADIYLETESARSAVYYAAWALEHHAPDAAAAVSIAKLYTSDASRTVGNRGIQVHGGMGFTWENDLHLYYRRAKASETMFGDATFHRERLARLTVDVEAVSVERA